MRKFCHIIFLVIGLHLDSSIGRPRLPHDLASTVKYSPEKRPYIIGGEVVEGREFPGQVSLQYFLGKVCGGSILNPEWILTAAHCASLPASDLSVVSGTNVLSSGGTKHDVTKVIVHESYNSSDSWVNDIAVMQVSPPFNFDNGTQAVILTEKHQEPSEGSKATVIGWGKLSENGSSSDELRKVDIFITNKAECDGIYYSEFQLHVYPTQICASAPEGNKGSCGGDSGGPLFVNGEVVGLVSWAEGCAEPGYPTVFTNVAEYRDWIESKTGA